MHQWCELTPDCIRHSGYGLFTTFPMKMMAQLDNFRAVSYDKSWTNEQVFYGIKEQQIATTIRV